MLFRSQQIADSANKQDAQAGRITNLTNKLYETNDSIQSLKNSMDSDIDALRKTDDWFTNIQLSLSADSTKGIVPQATDDPNWLVWTIDQSNAPISVLPYDRLIFREAKGNIPESDITIVYEGAPVIVVKYEIKDEQLLIYTKSKDGIVPEYSNTEGCINILTMHVQNAEITNEV